MDFRNGHELLKICAQENLPISEVMRQREITCGTLKEDEVAAKLKTVLSIMKDAVNKPLMQPKKSIGGLIGGEAKKVSDFGRTEQSICGSLMSKAISYSMAVLEVNASMGLIVAAPTAGSSGVLPGVLLALQEEKQLRDERIHHGLLNASAVGYILMRNASVSGAEAGCQAEVGAASAMAASAVVEIMGGTPEMSLQAASLAMSNLLGLVCDPIAGLVEAPCQSRNSIGASNAITCAELALAGVTHPIPFDEMAEAMYRVGKSIPFELRETAMGGCAGTPTGCSLCSRGMA
ncbi:L-serine ammonia-lyase, iron-sulfur-dependent, subunit alpha [Bariatricus massiliensis]|uniref:L-serine dehydratase n=1 Tax=Bariatricus massiliensis TaxID=1745713 RepID=A0ABS8DF33_9FIRM|nr:L-serine ammonia-lyase, iron-sulfur-dependent, subunit alpha [Bariatricus massiliensis]MCB7302523.1 L-serine ammonia-lyase, iron-sulfur-dependent, subunit alpha [Bariatricus massiliensis]MCB7373739.1 L-serine ammonia-lyase, iron-sulfur-dependent, subunit alpha [Bariatricus massiliensis]MCB7386409.1 L-serine ammonia-lyase, iron-sulfur-dependent, subunit alpha [Bariatricus massiliensis]MCB7410571.1 L-serine ammonia-lyase, iron-sulfur-dependent, subunit alpha [Bariatricus massiliensis]MCQ52535